MKKDTIQNHMESNIHDKLQYLPKKIDTMECTTIGNTSVTNCNMPTDTFNTVFSYEINEEEVKEVINYFQSKQLPMAWWLGPSAQKNSNATARMKNAGMVHDEVDIGMYCAVKDTKLDSMSVNPALEVKLCEYSEHFIDFGEVLSTIFDPVDEYVQRYYKIVSTLSTDMEKQKLFVGYVDGVAVTTGCVYLNEVAGIYDISTRPDQQKKGYGSTMFHAIMRFIKEENYQYATLQASEDGLNIYKRFGFTEICKFHVWSNKSMLKTSE